MRLGGAANLRERDHRTGLRQAQNVLKLMLAVLNRNGREHQTQAGAAEVEHKLLDGVGHLGQHDVIALKAPIEQQAAHAVDLAR